jgi:heme/copper-type cytochrome/quinol oxidase subunit 2
LLFLFVVPLLFCCSHLFGCSLLFGCSSLFSLYSLFSSFYLGFSNSIIILPLLATIKFIVYSYDVIHSLGIYSLGIKIDAIPGRYNVTSIIRTIIKGEHRGFCYELCGYGHSSMLIVGMVC